MAKYKIFETEQYQEDLRILSKSVFPKIEAKLKNYVYPQLKEEPHFGLNIKKLKGYTPPTWRYRIGDWRFFYEIDEEEGFLLMTAIHHRGRAY